MEVNKNNKRKKVSSNRKVANVKVNPKKEEKNMFVLQLKEYFSYYNKNYKKKHMIFYIISLILFFIFLSIFISSIDVTAQLQNISESVEQFNVNILNTILKEDIPISFLIIFAGITPFIHLPIIGFLYPYILAGNIANLFTISSHYANLIFMTVGSVIKIFAVSLAIVAGFDYCSYSSKKFRYSQGMSFGVQDLKRHYYTIRNNKEKVEEIDLQKNEKAQKKEKLNVKVPYKMLFYTCLICIIIMMIGTIITAI